MKAKVLFIGLVLSMILFVDYLVVTIIGCISHACNASEDFYCTFFCKFIVFLVVISSILPFVFAAYKTRFQKK